jgi:hypothetical protein
MIFLPHLRHLSTMDLSRPAVIGITTPGNNHVRNGKIRANQATLH